MNRIARLSILSMLFFTTLLGCVKDEPDAADKQDFLYVLTQCADPWDQETFRKDQATVHRVQAFLENEGVTVFDVSLRTGESSEAVCAACDCPSGWFVVVRALESDATVLETLSFSPLPRL